MPFKNSESLSNKDSDVDVDLEVSTMTKFYEIEEIFQKMKKSDFEDTKMWLDMLVYRLAEIFQNCMRSYDYLEKKDLRRSFLDRSDQDNALRFLKKWREDMFHNSKRILNITIHSDFMQMDGENFKGIHVKKGGCLLVGEHKFIADDSEFAFTTEGMFEIKNPDSKYER